MVLFRHVLIEKNQKVISLNNLDFNGLCQVMANVGWNVVNLADDRTVYYEKDSLGKYGAYDLNVLNSTNEIFDRVILLKYESAQIEKSISRKHFLLENVFVEKKHVDSKNAMDLSCSNVDQQSNVVVQQQIDEQPFIEIQSIVNLNDDQVCELSIENFNDSTDEQFTSDRLEDDQGENEESYDESKEDFSFDERRQINSSHSERILEQILRNQQKILNKVKKVLSKSMISFLSFSSNI